MGNDGLNVPTGVVSFPERVLPDSRGGVSDGGSIVSGGGSWGAVSMRGLADGGGAVTDSKSC